VHPIQSLRLAISKNSQFDNFYETLLEKIWHSAEKAK
jgi:hypothetical protein